VHGAHFGKLIPHLVRSILTCYKTRSLTYLTRLDRKAIPLMNREQRVVRMKDFSRKYDRKREEMVRSQIEARGIRDPRVLSAFRKVPRHLFVSEALREQAYGDYPLPIGEQQTISQPYIVAEMTQALELGQDDRVLEVGTGSG